MLSCKFSENTWLLMIILNLGCEYEIQSIFPSAKSLTVSSTLPRSLNRWVMIMFHVSSCFFLMFHVSCFMFQVVPPVPELPGDPAGSASPSRPASPRGAPDVSWPGDPAAASLSVPHPPSTTEIWPSHSQHLHQVPTTNTRETSW